MKRDYRLTEEFARWAFEIECKKTAGWYIAFTNPTFRARLPGFKSQSVIY